ncbi:MAG: hypothetical protein CVU23_06260, partial [Betaproteobacteria bacterium HGW-Betaproteobacteria-17]
MDALTILALATPLLAAALLWLPGSRAAGLRLAPWAALPALALALIAPDAYTLELPWLLLGLVGSVLATRLMPATYRVRATLALEMREPDANSPIQASALYYSSQWVELLTTDAVLTPVVVQRKLYIRGPNAESMFGVPLEGPTGPDASLFDNFERTETIRSGSYLLAVNEDGRRWELTHQGSQQKETGVVGDSVGRAFGFRWAPNLGGGRRGRSFRFDILTP